MPLEERLDIKEEYFPQNDEDYDDEIVDKFLAYLHQIYSEEISNNDNARSFPVSRNIDY